MLIVSEFETTTHLITNGVLTLLENSDQLDRIRVEPKLYDSAEEEIPRHRGPIHGTKLKYATEDIEWHGTRIHKGESVIPLLGAANNDPDVFEEPDAFDVARTPSPHLSFSHGPHFCLGSHLARREAGIALQELFGRFPDLGLALPLPPPRN